MFGWSISASACRSASKRAMTCWVSMPCLMTFSATWRRIGSLLGHVHHANAAFADELQDLVGPIVEPGSSAPGPGESASAVTECSAGRGQEIRRRTVGAQQVLQAPSQFLVAAAALGEESLPLVRLQLHRLVEEVLQTIPVRRFAPWLPPHVRSRWESEPCAPIPPQEGRSQRFMRRNRPEGAEGAGQASAQTDARGLRSGDLPRYGPRTLSPEPQRQLGGSGSHLSAEQCPRTRSGHALPIAVAAACSLVAANPRASLSVGAGHRRRASPLRPGRPDAEIRHLAFCKETTAPRT